MRWSFSLKPNAAASIVIGLGVGALVQKDFVWGAFFLAVGIVCSTKIKSATQTAKDGSQ